MGISVEYVRDSEHPHLCYTQEKIEGLHIRPHGLLGEKGTRTFKESIEFEPFGNSQACFRTEGADCAFDLFAASFFLCSRYEEYWDFYPDEHDRFSARESVLNQADLLQQPLVNQWALWLKDQILKLDQSLKFNTRKFEYISTIDIDQAWKYKHKGLKRNLAGFFRDGFQGKWENFKERWPVLMGLKKDPFFNFEMQDEWHSTYATEVKYFVLLADLGPFDKNIEWEVPAFQKLIKKLHSTAGYELGIHPSYQSNEMGRSQVEAEIKRLYSIIANDVKLSRQHFLMHKFPETYDQLFNLGIREEHSMGYSSHMGFRAGIAAPFPYYDFERECGTDLLLTPFCFMDVTPMHYMGLSLEEAKKECKVLMDRVKQVGGLFVSLWHNESLSESERWKGWRDLYPFMLEQAAKK